MSAATLGKKAFNAAKNRVKGDIREAVTGRREASTAEKIAAKVIDKALPGLKKYIALLGIFVILFLCALPSIIWAALQNYFGYVGEKYVEGMFEAGNIVEGVIQGGFDALGATVSYFFEKDEKSSYYNEADAAELEASLNITASESAERKSLIHYLNATKTKLNQRAKTFTDELTVQQLPIINYLKARYNNEFGIYPDIYKSGGVNFTFTPYQYKMADAVMLMSLYTVQTGGNVTDLSMSAYYFWLGQNRELFKTRIEPIQDDLSLQFSGWEGGVLPQYLMEQIKREREVFGKTVSNFDSCASAADLALYVDIPDLSTLEPRLNYDNEQKITIVTWDVDISIKCRKPEDIAYILGLFDGFETDYYVSPSVAGLSPYTEEGTP